MGMEQLYQANTSIENSSFRTAELKKLLKSLLLNFLEYIGKLSLSPESPEVNLDHIRTILVNIHHLLNEYRPHQSRESLILLLERQVEMKKEAIREIDDVCAEVRDRLKQLVRECLPEVPKPPDAPEVPQDAPKPQDEVPQDAPEVPQDAPEVPQDAPEVPQDVPMAGTSP